MNFKSILFGKILSRLFIGIYGLGMATSAYSATVSFVDQVAFQNAVGSSETFSFDDPNIFPLDDASGLFGPFENLTTQLSGMIFENSIVTVGDQGGTSRSAPNVVLNKDLTSPIIINFTQARRGVGLFNTSLVDAVTFEVFDVNDVLIGSLNLSDSVINFGGFVSDEMISKAVITPLAPTNGSIFIDDLMVSAVPIPAAIWLFGSGLIGLIGLAKRKKV